LFAADRHEFVGVAMVGGLDQRVGHLEEFVDGLSAGIADVGAMRAAATLAVLEVIDALAEFVLQPFALVRRQFMRLGAVLILR
jgi:hypothetical protein